MRELQEVPQKRKELIVDSEMFYDKLNEQLASEAYCEPSASEPELSNVLDAAKRSYQNDRFLLRALRDAGVLPKKGELL